MTNPKTLTLYEYPSPQFLNTIWKHPSIYPWQRKILKEYCDAAEKDGSVAVTYDMRSPYGRFVLSNNCACVTMWSTVRSTLFADTEYDIDIQACHQTIFHNLLMKLAKYNCESLERYCKDRDAVINAVPVPQAIIDTYNKVNSDSLSKKDIVKELFTILMFNGSVETWKQLYSYDDYTPCDFVRQFQDDMQSAREILLKKPCYKEITQSIFEWKKQAAKKKFGKKFEESKFNVHKGKLLAYILQDEERIIWLSMYEFLKDKCTITSYNYDGFQVLKEGFDVSLIDALNQHMIDKEHNVKFVIKPFKPPLDMTAIKEVVNHGFDVGTFNLIDDMEYKQEYFEKHHFKCREPCCMVVEKPDGELLKMKFVDFNNYYSNLFVNGNKDCFLRLWQQSSTQRCIHKIDFLPRPLECPPMYYNLWKGFFIEKTPSPSTPLETSVETQQQLLHYHIKTVLANGNNEGYEYILNWLASKVQYPAKKVGVILLFYGKQGTGKSTFFEMLAEFLIGERYCHIISDAEKAFGKWSTQEGKLLCLLNEVSGSQTFNLKEAIKDACTRKTNLQEVKYLQPVYVRDFQDFVGTTNNINCMHKGKDDRRVAVWEVSDKHKQDAAYFKRLEQCFKNPEVMRAFYDELMSRPLDGWSAENDRPQNAITKDMEEMNTEPLEHFRRYLIEQNEFVDKWVIATELYNCYKHWHSISGYKADALLTTPKFGVQFARLEGVRKEKKARGNMYYVDDI